MAQPNDGSVEERLARLERLVEELHRRLPEPARPAAHSAGYGEPAFAAAAAYGRAVDDAGAPWSPAPEWEGDDAAPRRRPEIRLDGQFWLNKLGIGLLLLGVALLFRYSIDQGWVTPARRVGFGALVGAGLLTAGLRMDETRRRFVPVLLGGAIATFYIVGFAAFLLYGLIGYGVAFAGMVAVTVLAYGLALHRNEPVLAILGAVGGLGTPLILGLHHATPRGMALHVSLILGWTCALYLMRGWRSVLWTSLAGGWLLLLLYADVTSVESWLELLQAVVSDRWAMQAAVVFAWAACGVLPFVRELRLRAASTPGDGSPAAEEAWSEGTVFHWHGLSLLPPLAALAATAILWQPSPQSWGWMALATAAGYQLASMALSRRDEQLARVLTLGASVFLSLGSVAAFDGQALLLILAGEALALLYLARRYYGPLLAAVGHLLYGAAGAWMLVRVTFGGLIGPRSALVDLAVIGTALGISFLVADRSGRLAYRFFAHVALLGWLWRELSPLPGGEGLATVAWGGYAVVLLVLAMRERSTLLERTAVATLLLVTAKLFLVDLAALEAIWRVLLFVGIGGGFLFLSYALQTWRRSQPVAEAEPHAAAAGQGTGAGA